MNRVNNWIFVALFFFIVSLGVMMGTNQPAVSWALLVPAIVAVAMALIRYEDHRKGVDIGYGA